MSRTYRRRGGDSYNLKYFVYEFAQMPGFAHWCRVEYDRDSKEYAKGKARYHSDGGTWSFKEPGPSWFRNLFTERPLRRHTKRELQKFMLDPEYEPMVEEMGKLEYWT